MHAVRQIKIMIRGVLLVRCGKVAGEKPKESGEVEGI